MFVGKLIKFLNKEKFNDLDCKTCLKNNILGDFLKRITFTFYSFFKNPKNYRNKSQKYLKKLKDIFKIKD